MADLCDYASRPLAFVLHYVRLRPVSHAVILAAVLAAVTCSVGTQYGVKFLVDMLSNHEVAGVWMAFLVLGALIAADNLLWRVASWIANFAFTGVTGDLRRDLFRHLIGPFACLFRQPIARHAHQPRHRDLERRFSPPRTCACGTCCRRVRRPSRRSRWFAPSA